MSASPRLKDARRHPRVDIRLGVVIHQDGFEIPGRLRNISASGVLVELTPAATIALRLTPMMLEIPGIGLFPLKVAWRGMCRFGAGFEISEAMRHHLVTQITALKRSNVQGTPARNIASVLIAPLIVTSGPRIARTFPISSGG